VVVAEEYHVAHIDELDALPVNGGEFVWRPVRRRFGITAFGTNAYTGDVGQRVIEEHFESNNGHEELYVVLRGRATFTLGDETVDASPGHLIFVRPGVKRGAVAVEDGTAVLAVGGRPGLPFEVSPWEDVFAAFSYAEQGRLDDARELVDGTLANRSDDWRALFNAACFEARYGDREKAIRHLTDAHRIEPDDVAKAAASDSDLDSIRDDDRVAAILRSAAATG
jgi:quercetin dioxygenase-like cupin family protein